MPEFTIAAVSPETRPWKSEKWGDFIAYKIKVEGSDEVIELSQKTTTDAPTVGQMIDGEIQDNGDFGKKFKKSYSGGQGGGGSDPQRDARIARQVAFKGAVEIAVASITAAKPDAPQVDWLSMVGDWTDRLLPIVTGQSAEGKAEEAAPNDSPLAATSDPVPDF